MFIYDVTYLLPRIQRHVTHENKKTILPLAHPQMFMYFNTC